ncbi:DUF2232 domain-containing protein [Spirulina subsalsa]|uniref:DUF2232 domain-containing protein n=1 Tax=Spirulina subsalsa TaxID=54311 RepID=UPI000308E514
MEDVNWVDLDEKKPNPPPQPPSSSLINERQSIPLEMVETAFLASAASLIWLINYYFPLGPILRIFFPIPLALIYLRWGGRAAGMGVLVSGLLLSVLMGPTRSILYIIPFGLLGVQLGAVWRRQGSWYFSIFTGTILGAFGFLLRFWLLSVFLGENLWVYVVNQMTVWVDWLLLRLGILAQPTPLIIEGVALGAIFLNSLLYLFVVHLVALLVFDRLGNPIPRPPIWVQVLFEYDY